MNHRIQTVQSILALFATIVFFIVGGFFVLPALAQNAGDTTLQFEQSHQQTGVAAVITRTAPPEQCHILGATTSACASQKKPQQCHILTPMKHCGSHPRTRILLNWSPMTGPAQSRFFVTPAVFVVAYQCVGGTGGLAVSGQGWMLYREVMTCDATWHTAHVYDAGYFQVDISRGAAVLVTGIYN